jgi:hypothetical protein
MTPRRMVVAIYALTMAWAMLLDVRQLQAQSYGTNGQVQSQLGDLKMAASPSRMLPVQESGGESEEEIDEIETDRDSFTPATSTAGRGRTIFESAYSFIDNRSVAETHSVPEIVTRYGLTDRIELRIGWNYEIGGAGNPISGNASELGAPPSELEEEAKLLYGTKLFLTEQNGWTPQSSFILQGVTPTFGESNFSTLSATHVFGWKLKNDWTWDSATRFSTSGTSEADASLRDHFNVWSPSTVIKVPLGERAKAHAEYFGIFSAGREEETTQHFISPGVNYLINGNLEVGARVAWGLNDQSPEFISNVGFGWRY